MQDKNWRDASGRKGKGLGAYRFTNDYGDINDYSPIFDPTVFSPQGDEYKPGILPSTAIVHLYSIFTWCKLILQAHCWCQYSEVCGSDRIYFAAESDYRAEILCRTRFCSIILYKIIHRDWLYLLDKIAHDSNLFPSLKLSFYFFCCQIRAIMIFTSDLTLLCIKFKFETYRLNQDTNYMACRHWRNTGMAGIIHVNCGCGHVLDLPDLCPCIGKTG